ncbi:MAG: hypothetical protein P4N41_20135 [Negativicutes bacterium]|nr:hypothetical protein [Negativicutes bacterium]
MKKKIAMMAVGLSLSMVPAVFAAEPVKLSGDVSVKYERDTASEAPTTSGSMYTLKLKGEADLGAGWSLYTRLGAQYATQPALSDYNVDSVYGPDRKSVVSLDQFGLTRKADDVVYKFGRQDLTIGTTALLYSRPYSNVGKHFFVDGLTAAGKVGIVDLSAAIVQEDNPGAQDNKIYAVRTGFNPAENLNWGVTLGRYQDSANGSTNHWAMDGTYKFGKSSLTGEYTKSSSSADNKAYAATMNYGFDDKTAVYITGFRVETNGDMGKQSDFDNDNRGIYYGVTHKLSDADNLEVVYKDQKFISTGQKNTKLEATITHSF